eukprot:tig00021128_g18898.t1
MVAAPWARHIARHYSYPGRLAGCEMRFKGNRQLFVVSVYMPATQRKPEHKTDQAALIECIERIYADFRSRSSAHLILLGDWNSVKTPATSASARTIRPVLDA